jgi:cellulose synthase/poly-beta-1,6-N-acetylglucosamine synthase-like glycosyltransferase
MMMLYILFWIFLGIVVYTYLGYTLVLFLLAGIHRMFSKKPSGKEMNFEPEVTLFIPAYNEDEFIDRKMQNIRSLHYPPDKLKVIWITDGSTDASREYLARYDGISVFHEAERRGKIHAMNRGILHTTTPYVIFTDANTMMNSRALREMIQFFSDSRVGCVAGEKRISEAHMDKAVGAGEGLYWKYESLIKMLESETGSAVGAVGELFAIRRDLFEPVSEDTLLDDFTISLQIACKGYQVKYSPEAWGVETASISVTEEMKRKVRIATGGMQTLFRMTSLLNPFGHGLLSFKYISHKVLRWTLVPFCFPLVFILNAVILFQPGRPGFYPAFFVLQCIYYLLAIAGAMLHNVRLRLKTIFAPYYLLVMNYAVVVGIWHYITGKYSVNWQKARRS